MNKDQLNFKLGKFRAYRNSLLTVADHEIFKLEDSLSDTTAWRAYRQSLREVTDAYKDANGDAIGSVESLEIETFQWPVMPY